MTYNTPKFIDLHDLYYPKKMIDLTDEQCAHNHELEWLYRMGMHETLILMGNDTHQMMMLNGAIHFWSRWSFNVK